MDFYNQLFTKEELDHVMSAANQMVKKVATHPEASELEHKYELVMNIFANLGTANRENNCE